MTERLFRCAGDIQFDDSPPVLGQVVDVKLKPFSETCNFLQYQKPLTKEHPYFFAQIRSLTETSVVSIGIAGRDIDDDVHPGNWNGTVGYRNTGRCFSSHGDHGNTLGQQFGISDIFGVMITYFGKKWSTAIFLKNGTPVATRYVFEKNLGNLLPTIALENGPIELGLMWPESVLSYPKYSETNLWQWIRPNIVQYNSTDKSFSTCAKLNSDVAVQSPVPLSTDIVHFEVIVLEASPEGKGPVISIDSCSPMYPQPTCPLLNDFFRWVPDGTRMKTRVGQRLGWGIHYNPSLRNTADFDDKAEQLVVCFVSIDVNIVHAKMMIQPEGGFYPVVLLNSCATKVLVDVESNRSVVDRSHLDELYETLLVEATAAVLNDKQLREITTEKFKMSPAFKVSIGDTYTNVVLPRDKKGIHVLQFTRPLRKDAPYFAVEIIKKGDSSVVCIGITDHDFPLNRYPGRLQNTVGYHSRDGKMYHNDKFNGNMTGQKFGKGDCVGVEVDMFGNKLSAILFRRNQRPVGTRFHSQPDHSKFLPTIAVCGNGSEVILNIVFQNKMSTPLVFQVANVEHWCVPERAIVEHANNIINVDPGHTEVEAIQAPYSLDKNYNHFEVEFVDEFDDVTPPPAIALCTASPMDPPSKSNFKQDFLRFWATGEARKAVKKGDLMGWGQLYAEQRETDDTEQLVICYLTINRDIVLTRVMYEPPGGFYPVVLLPVGVDRVKLNFGATIITEHPFTDDAIQQLLKEAQQLIFIEKQRFKQGTEPEEWDSEENKSKYLKPVPITAANLHKFKEFKEKFNPEQLKGLRRRPSKVDNFVDLMLETIEEDKRKASAEKKNQVNSNSDLSNEQSQGDFRTTHDSLHSLRTCNPFETPSVASPTAKDSTECQQGDSTSSDKVNPSSSKCETETESDSNIQGTTQSQTSQISQSVAQTESQFTVDVIRTRSRTCSIL